MKLGDPRIQRVIANVLAEARICAQYPKDDEGSILGYAAVATVFQCVLAVGESLTGSTNIKGNMLAVLQYMQAPQASLLPPDDQPYDNDEAAEALKNLRNALAHALLLPPDVALLPGRSFIQVEPKDRWRLLVPEFIDSVESAIAQATRAKGEKTWDLRGNANRIVPTTTTRSTL